MTKILCGTALTTLLTSHRVRRDHHAIVDPLGLFTSNMDWVLSHKHLLHTAHVDEFGANRVTNPQEWIVELDLCELDTISVPFIESECESFEVVIPPKGKLTAISVMTNEDYIFPILHRIGPVSHTYNQVPLRHHFCKS